MNLKITLKDPKYCRGCSCLTFIYWMKPFCQHYEMELQREGSLKTGNYIRPQKCIEENGE